MEFFPNGTREESFSMENKLQNPGMIFFDRKSIESKDGISSDSKNFFRTENILRP